MLNEPCFGWISTVVVVAGASLSSFAEDTGRDKPSPAETPAENPADRPMSAAMRRHVVDDSDNVGHAVSLPGESDCFKDDRPDTYESKLHQLIADVRGDLGMPDLPFVVGDLGQLLGIGANNPNPDTERVARINKVRNALKSLPDKVKNTACVQTTGLTYVDAPKCTHLDRESYIILGQRYCEAYEKVVNERVE